MSTSTPYIIAAKYQIYCAVNPTGRIMQVWGLPSGDFPEAIATDFPDPDTCTTHLVCATNNFTEAFRSWQANAGACRSHAYALGIRIHTLNSHLED
jgi:hypothetical protein